MKLSSKNIFCSLMVVILLLSLVSGVYAITGSIGNARMILRPDIGDTIDRTILVKNVNEVALKVELSAAGDLADEFEIIDSEFQLAAGGEKNARFKVKIEKAGTTETKINVKFSPLDEGNGVGLSSTIIIIPQGEEESTGGFFGGLFGGGGSGSGNNGEEVVEGTQDNGEVTVGQSKKDDVTGEVGEIVGEEKKESGMGLMVLGGTFTIILFVALLILLVVASKHIKKKKLAGKSDSDSEEKDDSDKKEAKEEAQKKGKSSKDDSDKDSKSSKDDSGPIAKSKKEKSKE